MSVSGSCPARSRTEGAVRRMHLASTLSRDPSSAPQVVVVGAGAGGGASGMAAVAWSQGRRVATLGGTAIGLQGRRGARAGAGAGGRGKGPGACSAVPPTRHPEVYAQVLSISPSASILGAPPPPHPGSAAGTAPAPSAHPDYIICSLSLVNH